MYWGMGTNLYYHMGNGSGLYNFDCKNSVRLHFKQVTKIQIYECYLLLNIILFFFNILKKKLV